MGYRLTVHIDKAPIIKNKDTEAKIGVKNTISVRNIENLNEVELELVRLRDKYTIAKGKNNKKMHKYGKELIYVSYEK
jgi:Iap family predicted aminopeptidase